MVVDGAVKGDDGEEAIEVMAMPDVDAADDDDAPDGDEVDDE